MRWSLGGDSATPHQIVRALPARSSETVGRFIRTIKENTS
jgi:hypothetical protein